MNVHGIRVNPYNLPSAKQYEYLANSLHELVATIDNNQGVPEQNIDAIERSEAHFFSIAHPVKKQLTSFLAKIDADYCARRPTIDRGKYDVEFLVRDANGEVILETHPMHMQEIASLHLLLVTRMLDLVHLNLACLVWFLAGFISSYFGEYQTHVKFTLVGLVLGLKKQVLGMALRRALLTIWSFAVAPWETVMDIYTDEIALRHGSAQEAECPCGYYLAKRYRDYGLEMYATLCTIAIAKLLSVSCDDLEALNKFFVLAACFLLLRSVVRDLM